MPALLRDEFWEFSLRHNLHLLEARYAYICKHGYPLTVANREIAKVGSSLPPLPSTLRMEREERRKDKEQAEKMGLNNLER